MGHEGHLDCLTLEVLRIDDKKRVYLRLSYS